MIIKNVRVYTEEKRFVPGMIWIKDGTIREVFFEECEVPQEEVLDGCGNYCVPGLIDIHFHGCMGYDFCDGTMEALEKISEYEVFWGITEICPATMTLPVQRLEEILTVGAKFQKQQRMTEHRGSDLIGINMEGPFISRSRKGAQDEQHIIPCSIEIYHRFQRAASGLVKYIAVAPEESETAAFIEAVKRETHVSLAHTNADYKKAKEAFDRGASHAVHLYNGMPPFHHRDPGVIGAVADSLHVKAELICDGIHIHPAVVRSAFKMLGDERIIFVSDSMRAAGMPDGRYMLGGQEVCVSGKHARLSSDGALAGSVTNLFFCMKTAVKEMGIPLETAISCVTVNPAKSLGVYKTYGSITPGKKGNLVLMDEALEIQAVIKDGKVIRISDPNRISHRGM